MALINIVCIFVSPNPRTAAIYYFITALFMLLACFDTYFALPLNVTTLELQTKVRRRFEDLTIMEKAPNRGRVGWLAWCLIAACPL